MQRNKKTKLIVLLGYSLIAMGLILAIISIIQDKNEMIKEQKNINDYIDSTMINIETDIIENSEFEEIVEEKEIENKKTDSDKDILLILEIPKINLNKGIYHIDSKYNNVKYNIQILKESDTPNIKNGNLILASHRGNSKVAFFDKLYKLKLKDNVFVYYNGIKYTYKVEKIYDIKKDGTAEIYRDREKNTLTLITCKKNTRDKQLVLIAYLYDTNNY